MRMHYRGDEAQYENEITSKVSDPSIPFRLAVEGVFEPALPGGWTTALFGDRRLNLKLVDPFCMSRIASSASSARSSSAEEISRLSASLAPSLSVTVTLDSLKLQW